MLAAVLSADHADRAAIGAVAPSLKHTLHISNAQLGELAAAFGLATLLTTLPLGWLVDRFARTRLLVISLVAWSGLLLLAAFSWSFNALLAAHVALGILAAVALPAISSLTGDLFPPAERGRRFTILNAGEVVGAGLGFVIAGWIAAEYSWRWAFAALSVLGLIVAACVRKLPEPKRGAMDDDSRPPMPRSFSWRPYAATLRVRTNVVVIVSSSLGLAFFGILRVFGVVYFAARFGLDPTKSLALIVAVGLASLAGFVVGGRGGDALSAAGHPSSRIVIAASAYVFAAVMIGIGASMRSLGPAVPFFLVGAFALAVPNPPLDAVRVNVIEPDLRGRAESLRVVVRTIGDALGPLIFGIAADRIAGGGHKGLQVTMLMFVPLLALAGGVLLFAVSSYREDAASVSPDLLEVVASEED